MNGAVPNGRLVCIGTSGVPMAAASIEIDLHSGEEATVGRGAASSFRINTEHLSRQHARLLVRDGQWHVEDLDSTNGVFVNGKKVDSGALSDGDEVAFGPIRFRFELTAPAASRTPEPGPAVAPRPPGGRVLAGAVESGPTTPDRPGGKASLLVGGIAGVLVLAAVAGGAVIWFRSQSPEPTPAAQPEPTVGTSGTTMDSAPGSQEVTRLAAEAEAKARAEEQARLADAAKATAEAEAAARQAAEAKAEEQARLADAARAAAEAEAAAAQAAEAEAKRESDEQARLAAAARTTAEAEAAARQAADAEAKRKAEEQARLAAAAAKAEADAEAAARQAAEAEAKRKAEEQARLAAAKAEAEAAARQAAEAEAKRKAEEQARLAAAKAEAEAAARQAAEAEAKRKAEEQARLAAAKAKAEAEAAATQAAEAEAKRKAEEKARLAAAAKAKAEAEEQASRAAAAAAAASSAAATAAPAAARAPAPAPAPAAGGDLNGRQILDEVAKRHDRKFEFEIQTMTLIDRSGTTEERELRRYVREEAENEKRLVSVFHSPTGVKGVALLTWQYRDKPDDQWLFLPAQGKQMKRIAKGGQKNYFMGTDYTFEDLVSESRDKFEYVRQPDETVDGAAHFVVRATASDADLQKETGYAYRILWIRQDNFVISRVDFFDKRERLTKRQINEGFERVDGDTWRPRKSTMEHLKNDHKTVVEVTKRSFEESDVPDRNFQQRTIETGRILR